MNARLVELAFESPVHFGTPGVGVEATDTWLHSDSVFAALACAWAELYGDPELEVLLDRFDRADPPFRLSSAFPFRRTPGDRGDPVTERFYPRPLGIASDARLHAQEWKRLKRSRWISEPLFSAWIHGRSLTSGDMATLPEENDLVRKTLIPRVSLDRATQNSNLYHVGMAHFLSDYDLPLEPNEPVRLVRETGLFVLVDCPDEELWIRVQAAFHWLGDNGIGGERSSGCGRFQPRFVPSFALEEPDGMAVGYCLLSLCAPTPDDAIGCRDGRARFDLSERGGWVGTRGASYSARRKSVWYFTEGSVLPRRPTGRMHDVTPSGLALPIRAYGFALSVRVTLPKTDSPRGLSEEAA